MGHPYYRQNYTLNPTPPPTYTIEVYGGYDDERSNIASVVYSATGNLVTGRNIGISGAIVASCVGNAIAYAPYYMPKYVIFQAGVNDLSGSSTTFGDLESHYDDLLADCVANGRTLIVGEVWPAAIATAAAINAYNAALNSWANENGVYVMHTHDWLADPDNNDIMDEPYQTDWTHPSNAGVSRYAEIIIATLEYFEPTEPAPGDPMQSARSPRHIVRV